MRIHIAALFAAALLLCLSLTRPASASTDAPTVEAVNTRLVQRAFEDWKQGRGSVFDLLADGAEWKVAGSSPVSGTYRSRQELLDRAVRPIHARLSTPISPEVRHIIAQGPNVVVLWDGTATAKDGGPYLNSYAWHLVMANGRITQVTAFLDTWRLNELMK